MTIRNESGTFDVGGDLTVNRLGFGAMRLTGERILGEPDDVEMARSVLRRLDDLGVNFVDTADAYGPGVSERLLGETLDVSRDDLVVATKAGLIRTLDGDWPRHGDPDYVENAFMCSRDRLGVDVIDLYQYHRPDPDTPFDEAVAAFGKLKDDGLVRHVGLSNVSVEQLEAAREVVDVATVQNEYNVADRTSADVLSVCEELDIGFIPWRPVGGGDLGDRQAALEEIADAHDATRYQISLAWLLQHSPVTLPIPGTSDPEHLAENVAASAIELTDEEMKRLA